MRAPREKPTERRPAALVGSELGARERRQRAPEGRALGLRCEPGRRGMRPAYLRRRGSGGDAPGGSSECTVRPTEEWLDEWLRNG